MEPDPGSTTPPDTNQYYSTSPTPYTSTPVQAPTRPRSSNTLPITVPDEFRRRFSGQITLDNWLDLIYLMKMFHVVNFTDLLEKVKQKSAPTLAAQQPSEPMSTSPQPSSSKQPGSTVDLTRMKSSASIQSDDSLIDLTQSSTSRSTAVCEGQPCRTKIKALKHQLSEMRSNLAQYETFYKRLEHKYRKVKDKLESKDSDQYKVYSLDSTVKHLMDDVQNYRTDKEAAEAKCFVIETEMKHLKSQKKKWKSMAENLKVECDKLQQQHLRPTRTVTALEYAGAKRELKTLKIANNNLKQKCKVLQKTAQSSCDAMRYLNTARYTSNEKTLQTEPEPKDIFVLKRSRTDNGRREELHASNTNAEKDDCHDLVKKPKLVTSHSSNSVTCSAAPDIVAHTTPTKLPDASGNKIVESKESEGSGSHSWVKAWGGSLPRKTIFSSKRTTEATSADSDDITVVKGYMDWDA